MAIEAVGTTNKKQNQKRNKYLANQEIFRAT